jgi:hypothetical protein
VSNRNSPNKSKDSPFKPDMSFMKEEEQKQQKETLNINLME